jgi:hypothetical protein
VHNEPSRAPRVRLLVSLLPAFVGGLALATPSHAGLVPGGGAAKSDCYVELEVAGIENPSQRVQKNKIVLCTDGEACDTGPCGDNRCDMELTLCVNQHDPNLSTCTPPANLDLLKAKSKGKVKINIGLPQALTGSVCGALLDLPLDIPLKKNGLPKKFGQAKLNVTAKAPKGTKPRTDGDEFTVKCLPRTVACPPVTTTTTTLPPACGNNTIEAGEQCDPPGSGQGRCAANELCNSLCQCVVAIPCTCGAPEPTNLNFVTEVGTGDCGLVEVSSGVSRVLKCGGLYFGGGAESVPLPAPLPDMGVSVTKTTCSGNTLTLSETTAADTCSGRSCTAKDCLFGAPLPIPNLNNRPLSTCVLNVVARGATGTADCQTGETAIDLPLRSDIYLFGDLLNGSTPERPDIAGLQPCPICSKTCSGGGNDGQPCTADGDCPSGTCPGSPLCLGGANHGLACTPATSILGQCDRCPASPGPGECKVGDQCRSDADCPGEQAPGLPAFCNIPFPTSHDCPPPVVEGQQPIGRLPIAFALTTGTASATAADLNGPTFDGFSDAVFCGFCRDVDDTYNFGTCQGGDFPGVPCAQRSECCVNAADCPAGTCGGAIRCQANADCSQPLEACSQRNNGAFAKLAAKTITLTGSPSGPLVDRAPHDGTLVGTFCIPPIFDPSIDAAADTPGPGATAIPGKAQLLP